MIYDRIESKYIINRNKYYIIISMMQKHSYEGEIRMNYKKLNKKAMTYMYVVSLLRSIVGILILMVIRYFLIQNNWIIAAYIVSGLIGVLLLNFFSGSFVRYNRYAYFINDEYIDVKEGFLFIERKIVPIERLHNIEISNGPISRRFNLSEVKVTTAGSTVSIQFLENEEAEAIVQSLQKRINTVAREKKLEILSENQGTKEV